MRSCKDHLPPAPGAAPSVARESAAASVVYLTGKAASSTAAPGSACPLTSKPGDQTLMPAFQWKNLAEVQSPAQLGFGIPSCLSTSRPTPTAPAGIYRFRPTKPVLKDVQDDDSHEQACFRITARELTAHLPFECRETIELGVPYCKQGSSKYYSREALRTRASLARNLSVRAAIDRFWNTFFERQSQSIESLVHRPQSGHEPGATAEGQPRPSKRRSITMEQYGMLLVRLSKALHADYTKEKAFQLALADCARDQSLRRKNRVTEPKMTSL